MMEALATSRPNIVREFDIFKSASPAPEFQCQVGVDRMWSEDRTWKKVVTGVRVGG